MAVVKPANLAPDALPRVRGAFHVRPYRGIYVAAKWPRKRGPPKAWGTIWTSQMWAYAGRMAANPEPLSYQTAVFMAEGTTWLPRDILTMLAYGKFYEVYLPDGTLAERTYHGPPPLPASEIPTVQQWIDTAGAGAYAAANSTSAFAFKGCRFITDQQLTIDGVSAILTPVNGASYKAVACTLNASNQITAISSGATQVLSGTTKKVYAFPLSHTWAAGERCAVMLGRTDGAANYALPMVAVANSNILIPGQDLGFARIASTNPAITNTLDVGTPAFTMSMLLTY